MPIDLDAPIFAIPCGDPGDLDALSGRAHACDRMRIAVTECKEAPPGYPCWPCQDVPPKYLELRIPGLRLCSCRNNMGRSIGEELLEGSLTGPWVLPQRQGVSWCQWWIGYDEPGPLLYRRIGYRLPGCQDYDWESVFRPTITIGVDTQGRWSVGIGNLFSGKAEWPENCWGPYPAVGNDHSCDDIGKDAEGGIAETIPSFGP